MDHHLTFSHATQSRRISTTGLRRTSAPPTARHTYRRITLSAGRSRPTRPHTTLCASASAQYTKRAWTTTTRWRAGVPGGRAASSRLRMNTSITGVIHTTVRFVSPLALDRAVWGLLTRTSKSVIAPYDFPFYWTPCIYYDNSGPAYLPAAEIGGWGNCCQGTCGANGTGSGAGGAQGGCGVSGPVPSSS